MKLVFAAVLATFLLFVPRRALAQDPAVIHDAIEFHELLRLQLPPPLRNNVDLSMFHMIPNQEISELPQASGLQAAFDKVRPVKLAELIANNRVTPAAKVARLQGELLTVVVLPGLFAEFLPHRIFEEILSRPSQTKAGFEDLVRRERAQGNQNAEDDVFDIRTLSLQRAALSELIHVGALTNSAGGLRGHLVYFSARLGSQESFGDLHLTSEVLNRRLEKFIQLTDAKRILILGYSRGATVGLEMLAQAKERKAIWLSRVQALVSLGGPLWGLSAADENLNSGTFYGAIFTQIKKLHRDLDPASSFATGIAWKEFSIEMDRLVPEIMKGRSYPAVADLISGLNEVSGLEAFSLVTSIKNWSREFDIENPRSPNFAQNVQRFRRYLEGVLIASEQLSTAAREAWWKKRSLPQSVVYYSLLAAMANPKLGLLDQDAFDGNWGYAKGSFDDLWLLQNRLDEELRTGIVLNDGEISLPQGVFLPKVLETLNPANRGLKTVMLGICGTHHWGLAFQSVHRMKNHRINPFPREVLLSTLIEKITIDAAKLQK